MNACKSTSKLTMSSLSSSTSLSSLSSSTSITNQSISKSQQYPCKAPNCKDVFESFPERLVHITIAHYYRTNLTAPAHYQPPLNKSKIESTSSNEQSNGASHHDPPINSLGINEPFIFNIKTEEPDI